MPLLDNNPTLLQSFIRLTATLFLFFFLLPLAFFSLIFILIHFILFLPIFSASSFCLSICKIVFRCPIRFLSFILASFKSHPTIETSLESSTQECIDLDDSGPPSLDEFEEQEEEQGGGEFSGFMEYRMYRVIVEHNPVC